MAFEPQEGEFYKRDFQAGENYEPVNAGIYILADAKADSAEEEEKAGGCGRQSKKNAAARKKRRTAAAINTGSVLTHEMQYFS